MVEYVRVSVNSASNRVLLSALTFLFTISILETILLCVFYIGDLASSLYCLLSIIVDGLINNVTCNSQDLFTFCTIKQDFMLLSQVFVLQVTHYGYHFRGFYLETDIHLPDPKSLFLNVLLTATRVST